MILGIKATHDGGFALIDDLKLVLAVEWEKVNNNERHARPSNLGEIAKVIYEHGIDPTLVDAIAYDAWWPDAHDWVEVPRPLVQGITSQAPYLEETEDLYDLPEHFGMTEFAGEEVQTFAYPHSVGHVFGAYCTSPFAREEAHVLVWDGGMRATMYEVSPDFAWRLGVVLPITGNLYPVFCSMLAPYREQWEQGPALELVNDRLGFANTAWSRFNLSVPGKAMAYAGLGEVDERAVSVLDSHRRGAESIGEWRDLKDDAAWAGAVEYDLRKLHELSDPDLMASFQEWEYRELEQALRRYAKVGTPLIFTGGCALNIKWNSRLRASGLSRDVWVPPFPNDSGGALGAACAHIARYSGAFSLEWSVFDGPRVMDNAPLPLEGWTSRSCTTHELGAFLASTHEPVVVINGNAELGPRALGHRSILASARTFASKVHLNEMKGREGYRPVAPICLEEDAPWIFDPGTPDPYMLYDHRVRRAWAARIPAVVHADGTARLQTVKDGFMREVLTAYRALSGVPVLCNTSANYNGRGFFPDARSAMQWGKAAYVWSEHVMYERLP